MDATISQCVLSEERRLLTLPAEIRLAILEHVFSGLLNDGFANRNVLGGVVVDEEYSANDCLKTLSTCRQFYEDGNLLALNRTSFVISNLFFQVPERLSVLHPKQVEALRNIAFVADARHFRKLIEWGEHPFGMTSLHLDTLTIVLHRSSFWHYLFDFTADITKLLRTLEGVRCLYFVRNGALVKGSLKTWYNRLIGLVMKVDHHERYEKIPPNPEKVWWEWSYDEMAQSVCFQARSSRPIVDEETYMLQMKPLLEDLTISMENEAWNPDPRSRNMYY